MQAMLMFLHRYPCWTGAIPVPSPHYPLLLPLGCALGPVMMLVLIRVAAQEKPKVRIIVLDASTLCVGLTIRPTLLHYSTRPDAGIFGAVYASSKRSRGQTITDAIGSHEAMYDA